MLRITLSFLLLVCSPLVLAEVKLLASIKPLQLIAAAVQDGLGSPEVLLPPGASAHNFALRPSDVRRVQDARLLYWIGPDMEAFLPRVLQGRNMPSVAVQELPDLQLRYFAAPAQVGQAAEAASEAHDHDHRPGSLDAHLWLSTVNARRIAAKMAADLAALDPANAPRYQENLRAFETRLDALDARLDSKLADLRGKPFFVFHEAFDYFEAAHGLRHAGVFSMGSEVQPGARRVAQMRAQLVAAGAACVFSEPPVQPRLAQTLSAGLPVRLAELDPLGTGIKVSARGYEQLLEELAAGMRDCLADLAAAPALPGKAG